LLQAAATRRGGDLCSALFSVCLCGLVGDLTVATDAFSRRHRTSAPRGEKQNQYLIFLHKIKANRPRPGLSVCRFNEQFVFRFAI
jgi:hypothetical protein